MSNKMSLKELTKTFILNQVLIKLQNYGKFKQFISKVQYRTTNYRF